MSTLVNSPHTPTHPVLTLCGCKIKLCHLLTQQLLYLCLRLPADEAGIVQHTSIRVFMFYSDQWSQPICPFPFSYIDIPILIMYPLVNQKTESQ